TVGTRMCRLPAGLTTSALHGGGPAQVPLRMGKFAGEIVRKRGPPARGASRVARSLPNVGKLTCMTSSPDQSPAATAGAGAPDTDPVTTSSMDDTEQVNVPGSATDERANGAAGESANGVDRTTGDADVDATPDETAPDGTAADPTVPAETTAGETTAGETTAGAAADEEATGETVGAPRGEAARDDTGSEGGPDEDAHDASAADAKTDDASADEAGTGTAAPAEAAAARTAAAHAPAAETAADSS